MNLSGPLFFDGKRFEKNLEVALKCLEDLHRALSIGYSQSTRYGRNKKARTTQNQEEEILNFRRRWSTLLSDLFDRSFIRSNVSNQLALDIVRGLRRTKSLYPIDSKLYEAAISSIVSPLIQTIMDESQELNRTTRKIQECRATFLYQIVNVEEEHNTVAQPEERSADNIPVVEISSQSSEHHSSRTASNQQNQLSFSFESETIIDLLVNSLTIHSRNITNQEFDKQIFQIVNITYIVELILKIMVDFKMKLQVYHELSDQEERANNPIYLRIKNAFQRYEKNIEKNFETLEWNSPLQIYRSQLRLTLIHLRVMKPLTT